MFAFTTQLILVAILSCGHCLNGPEIELPLGTVELIELPSNTSRILTIKEETIDADAFWTFEAHSQENVKGLILSLTDDAFNNQDLRHNVVEATIQVI